LRGKGFEEKKIEIGGKKWEQPTSSAQHSVTRFGVILPFGRIFSKIFA
jgi:hypothetical protein